MSSPADATGVRTALWDLPVRVIHWSFVVLIPALWWTAENDRMALHMQIGTVLLQLLVIRVLWGCVGGSTARFAAFVRGPGAMLAYLRGKTDAAAAGHNPAGGWSVIALLGLMGLQVTLGLFSGDEDDGAVGPLNHLVSFRTADRASNLHGLVFYAILALIALHLAAIVYYRVVRRDRLITPMVTGKRVLPAGTPGLVHAPAWRFFACVVVAWLVGWAIWSGVKV
ncbi:cytochrome b [Novosphingobium sp. PhB165]|uniref:cytochrome b/b6 domain-containing protein n=1 Tax=Novosphingobium sp. PhB165 TaxID=2485105 RepID=UPI00104DD80D|nr:cytochrome b/b6 domain-containing protein [Novosphingobium sp. PhB165]TCM19666.1 cytochrome b [Novosphingobium sp. PhB165]